MPPNKPQTALSLEAFRQNIGWQQFLFYQLTNKLVPVTDSAELVAVEYTWQKPMAASRSDFRRAIQTAEQKLCDLLNYDVSTRYRTEAVDPGYLRSLGNQTQNATNYGNNYGYGNVYPIGYYGYGVGYSYAPSLIQLEVGKLQKIATVSYTALTDFAVTITDEDGDGVMDTFTGTFTNSDATLDLSAVVIAFKDADQVQASATGAATSDPTDWLVRPVTVTRLDASTIQVIGPSWLLVKPVLYEKAGPAAGYNSAQTGVDSSGTFDPNDTTNTYVAGLAAWQKVYTDANTATFVRRYGGDEYPFQVPVTIVNADLGQVQIDLWGCYTCAPSFYPGLATDELRINYEAGATAADYKRFPYLKYQTDWETLVARFAIAELPQVPAATQRQNPALFYWREDLARTGSVNSSGAGDTFRISNDILNNPFRNTRRGAVEAFQAVSSLAQHRAVNF